VLCCETSQYHAQSVVSTHADRMSSGAYWPGLRVGCELEASAGHFGDVAEMDYCTCLENKRASEPVPPPFESERRRMFYITGIKSTKEADGMLKVEFSLVPAPLSSEEQEAIREGAEAIADAISQRIVDDILKTLGERG
jgi:hypothetical protein